MFDATLSQNVHALADAMGVHPVAIVIPACVAAASVWASLANRLF